MKFQGIYIKDDNIELRFIKVSFRDSILGSYWYDGQNKIWALDFHECNIQLVKARAFDHQSLQNVEGISFNHQEESIHFENNAFDGMLHLRSVTFNCIVFRNIDAKIIWGFERSLRYFQFLGIIQFISLQDLFGGGLASLLTVEITNHKAVSVLAPGNFTRMPEIVNLSITKTNIEVIRAGAFDEIARTLRFIQLCGLKLLKIDPSVF